MIRGGRTALLTVGIVCLGTPSLRAAAPAKPAPADPKVAPADSTCTFTDFTDPKQKDASVLTPHASNCFRDGSVFQRAEASATYQPSYADRLEAERWLENYPLCVTYLQQQISKADAQVHDAASNQNAAAGGAASCELKGYTQQLTAAQIQSHEAYGIIRQEYTRELDFALWAKSVHLGWSLLGGAGGALSNGLVLDVAVRDHVPPGLRFGVTTGIARTANLTLAPDTGGLFEVRDDKHLWTVPVMLTASWGWTHSWFFVGAGGAWTRTTNDVAAIARIGAAFLKSGIADRPTDCGPSKSDAGLEGELRFVAEPWYSALGGSHRLFSMLFGVELSLGVGWERRNDQCPYPEDEPSNSTPSHDRDNSTPSPPASNPNKTAPQSDDTAKAAKKRGGTGNSTDHKPAVAPARAASPVVDRAATTASGTGASPAPPASTSAAPSTVTPPAPPAASPGTGDAAAAPGGR